MSNINLGRKHPHEDAIREGADFGSDECQRVCAHWDEGTSIKGEVEAKTIDHHRYYDAVREGAKKGSGLCKTLVKEWREEGRE